MTNDLNYTRLEQLKQALESDDPGLGSPRWPSHTASSIA